MTTEVRPGLMGSAARLGASVIALAESKLLLFANEFESERVWMLRIGLRVAITLLALTLACLFLGLVVVQLLWDWSRTLALATPVAIFLGVAVYGLRTLATLCVDKPPAFAETLAALRRDRNELAAFGQQGRQGDD